MSKGQSARNCSRFVRMWTGFRYRTRSVSGQYRAFHNVLRDYAGWLRLSFDTNLSVDRVCLIILSHISYAIVCRTQAFPEISSFG
jgi:hypothetical protein